MNKRFISFSLAVLLGFAAASTEFAEPSFLVEVDDYEKASCYIYKDWTLFDLRPLYKKEGYTNKGYNVNFCKPFELQDPEAADKIIKTYAYTNKKTPSGDKAVLYTDGDLLASKRQVFEDENGERHLRFVRDTNVKCAERDGVIVNYTATFEIDCNSTGKRDAPLNDLKVNDTDPCNLHVTGSHRAGCPILQVTSIVQFMAENPWTIGVLLIAFGFVSTFFGGKFFPYVLATVGGGVTFLAVLIFASAFGALKALESKGHRTG